MVRIRLSRTGAKKKPFYHVVATDQRSRRDGRYIERLGYFNPVARGKETPLMLDVERIEYWEGQGAQTSERVASLVKHFKNAGGAEALAAKQQELEAARKEKAAAKIAAAEKAKAEAAAAEEKAAKEAEAKAAEEAAAAEAKAAEEAAAAEAKAAEEAAPEAEAKAEDAEGEAAEEEKKD